MNYTVTIYDERFESGPRLVGEHKNVPENWTRRDILDRFGVQDHLCVYKNHNECIQHGSRFEHDR